MAIGTGAAVLEMRAVAQFGRRWGDARTGAGEDDRFRDHDPDSGRDLYDARQSATKPAAGSDATARRSACNLGWGSRRTWLNWRSPDAVRPWERLDDGHGGATMPAQEERRRRSTGSWLLGWRGLR